MSTTALKASYSTATIAKTDLALPTTTPATEDKGSALAVSVKVGGGEVRTFSAEVAAGASDAERAQAMANLLNDANIGVGAFVRADDGVDLVTGVEGIELSFAVGVAKEAVPAAPGTTPPTPATPALTAKEAAEAAASTKAKSETPDDKLKLTVADKNNRVKDIDLGDAQSAQKAVLIIDQSIQAIDSQRAQLGAVQNRFENTIANLQNIGENVSAARGRLQDTDFAAETANLTKNQILQQAGTAILAQANQLPQAVLSLLR